MSDNYGKSVDIRDNSAWLQFGRADSKNTILAFADPNPHSKLYVDSSFQGNPKEKPPKYAITLINYSLTDKSTNKRTIHFITEGQLGLIANCLLNNLTGSIDSETNKYSPIILDYKGGLDKTLGVTVSRSFTLTYSVSRKSGYYFNLKKTDGAPNATGAVLPTKNGTVHFEGNIFIPDVTAQALGADIDMYIRAKKVAQVMEYRSKPNSQVGMFKPPSDWRNSSQARNI